MRDVARFTLMIFVLLQRFCLQPELVFSAGLVALEKGQCPAAATARRFHCLTSSHRQISVVQLLFSLFERPSFGRAEEAKRRT